MTTPVLIAHAEGDERIAASLAEPIGAAGYEVVYSGTVLIGDSVVEQASKVLSVGGPVVLCGTVKALGTGWAHRLVNAARRNQRSRVFAVKVDEDAYLDQLALDGKVAPYWQDPAGAITDLVNSLHHYYPLEQNRAAAAAADGAQRWLEFKAAAFEAHRALRLQVIAGTSRDLLTEIPVSEIFVPPMASRELPIYEVPEQVLLERRRLFGPGGDAVLAPAEEDVEREATDALAENASSSVGSSFPEPTLNVFGRERTQVFLGGPGSGKSTLLLYALLLLCDPAGQAGLPELEQRPVPFLIDLRHYVSSGLPGFVSYLASDGSEYGVLLDPEQVRELLHEDGKALVLFDGLDEVFDPQKRDHVIRQFGVFARQFPTATIVVTSRIVAYDPRELGLARFTHYVLNDFRLPEIREFVPKWFRYYSRDDRHDAQDLIRKIAMSPRLTELAGNPLLLTMMAVLYKREDLPDQRWKLYESCTKVLLEDWDIKRKKIGRKELFQLDIPIDKTHKAEILQQVAMHMLDSGEADREVNAISERPLVGIFTEYLVKNFERSPGEASVLAGEILNHLAERTYVVAQIGEGIFGFVHRTFMEYFAACQLKEEFSRRKANYEWLKTEVFGPRWGKNEWQEVLLLLAGMLAGQHFPMTEVVEYLRRECAQPVPFNVAFAARCLGEAGVVDDREAGRALLTELVDAIAEQAGRKRSVQTDAFLKEGLAAFASLVPRVGVPQRVERTVDQLNSTTRARERMAGWQMGLAQRSRDEQRSFALEALFDGSEVVRRAAVAALERDWPGDGEVGEALISVVAQGGSMRVRQAVIEALHRSWPRDPRLLDAIDATAARESAYTYVVWLIEQIAQHYPGDPKSLPVILRLAGPKETTSFDFDERAVVRAATQAIAAGWGGESTALPVLEDWAGPGSEAPERVAAVFAIGTGWRDDPGVGLRLREWARDDADAAIRNAAITALACGWSDDPAVLPFLLERSSADPDPAVRRNILTALTWPALRSEFPAGYDYQFNMPYGVEEFTADSVLSFDASALGLSEQFVSPWGNDARVVEMLGARATADDAESVRGVALQALARVAATQETLDRLLERGENDDAPAIRGAALRFASEGWPSDERLQELLQRLCDHADPNVRAQAITVVGSYWATAPWTVRLLENSAATDADASVRANALWALAAGRRAEPEMRDFLLNSFRHDTSADVRVAALRALAAQWPKHRDTLPLVFNTARRDPDPAVRAVCILMLSRRLLGTTAWNEFDPDFSFERFQYKVRSLDADFSLEEAAIPELDIVLTESLYEDPDPRVRRVALSALALRWWEGTARPGSLTELLKTETDDAVRAELQSYEAFFR